MKTFALYMASAAILVSSSAVMADTRLVSGAEPVQTYTVCNHDALFAVNDRAVRIKSGGRSFTDNGSTFIVGYTPDVFLQTKRLVRHSYRSLSASGECY